MRTLRLLPVLLLALAVGACDSSEDDVVEADNDVVRANSTVTVDYEGRYTDGVVFDPGGTATFPLRQVIPGFRDGVVGMRVGESRTFEVPPEQGYGPNPTNGIRPNATLVFDVELLAIQ